VTPICPWCSSTKSPIPNNRLRDPDGEHRRRNPIRCSECDGVGGYEDFFSEAAEEKVLWVERDVPNGEPGHYEPEPEDGRPIPF